jgi:hypothetical protein
MDIIAAYPQHKFLPAAFFSYDAADEVINYSPVAIKTNSGKLALLHEISHCELGHFHYQSDLQLYAMEIDAWGLTMVLAKQFNIKVSQKYIDECLDSYDYWIEKRGTCPNCATFCIQNSEIEFECYNCATRWRVNTSPQVRTTRRILPAA